MKLKRLTIHNIASIAHACIDFSQAPLNDAEVFLISGKTGTGKTTILDCICLALYATAPRFKNSRISGETSDDNDASTVKVTDPRQILRRGSATGYSELEFTGNNGVNYRACWSVERARKKIDGRLKRRDWSIENIDTGNILVKDSDIHEEIAAAVGLDFDQFCRTVLLAQGEFTRFLNSNDNDKSEILSKITGTDIYAKIGASIFERNKNVESEYNLQLAKMREISVLSDDEIDAKKELLNNLIAEREILNKDVDFEKKLVDKINSLQCVEAENETLSKKLVELQKNFVSLIGWRSSEQKRLQNGNIELNKLLLEIDAHKKSQSIYENSAELLLLISNILDYKKNITAQTEAAKSFRKNLDETLYPQIKEVESLIREINKKIEVCESTAKSLSEQLDEMALKNLHSLKERILSDRIEYQNISLLWQNLDAAKKRFTEDCRILKLHQEKLTNLRSQYDANIKPLESADENVRVCKSVYDRLFTSSEKILASIRSSLNVGDICPVCRREIMVPLPAESEIKALINENKDALTNAENHRDALLRKQNTLQAEIKTVSTVVLQSQDKLNNDRSIADTENQIRERCESLKLEWDDDEKVRIRINERIESLGRELNNVNDKIKDAEKIENELKTANGEFKSLVSRLQNEKDKLNELKASAEREVTAATLAEKRSAELKDQLNDDLSNLHQTLKSTKYTDFISEDIALLGNEIKNDINKYNSLIAKHSDLSHSLEKDRISLDNIDNVVTILKTHFTETPENVANNTPLESPLLESPLRFASNILSETAAVKETFNKNLKTIKDIEDSLSEIKTNHPDISFSPQDSLERINLITNKMQENDMKIGAINKELQINTLQLERISELKVEIETIEKQLQRWHTLNAMFGDSEGKKFRRIAQSYILSELINCANYYMKSLSNRYTLRVEPGTFVIQVEDAWNGYTVRSAATISGGESFLVSLSLALALSDIGVGITVDTLFIDEGFGTLSDDALQNAIATLRTLHTKAGRKVGIISHIDELRDKIPVRINVNREGNSSESFITITS